MCRFIFEGQKGGHNGITHSHDIEAEDVDVGCANVYADFSYGLQRENVAVLGVELRGVRR